MFTRRARQFGIRRPSRHLVKRPLLAAPPLDRIVSRHSRQLAKLGTPELKHHDISVSDQEIDDANARVTPLNNVPQGDDNNQRLGDTIRMKSPCDRDWETEIS